MGIIHLAIIFLSFGLGSCASDVPPSSSGGGDAGTTTSLLALGLGVNHTCAVSPSNILKCWGSNLGGQIGDGSQDDRSAPVTIDLGDGRSARALALGNYHTCAILDDDSLWCWGFNYNGQLGDPDIVGTGLTPASIDLGEGRSAKAIAAGNFHTCAILDDHSLKCWGSNNEGQVGDGTSTAIKNSPTSIALGAGRSAKAISAGDQHTCAVLDDDTLKCWGKNNSGQLGDGTTTKKNTPTLVDLGEGATAKKLSAGFEHTCAILNDYTLKCWGKNNRGQLGTNSADNENCGDDPNFYACRKQPTLVGLGDARVFMAAAGSGFSCAQTGNYALICWGVNNYGQLGDGTDDSRTTLDTTSLLPRGRSILDLQTGDNHICARMEDNSLLCWGNNSSGQLGTGNEWSVNPLLIDLDS